MDLNTELTYVTCIYDDLFGTEFGGRPDPVWRRYYYGLESATKMLAPIVIFTWSYNVKKVQKHFRECLGEEQFNAQIKIVPFNLKDSPLYELIKSIKTYEQGYKNDRSYDLAMAKFLFLKHGIERNYFDSKYIFWLDSGLSHCNLFPNKFLQNTNMDKQYSDCTLFTPAIPRETIKRCQEKLLLFQCNSVGHWLPPELTNEETRNSSNLWYIIGGYFGGKKELLSPFCDIILTDFQNYIKNHNLLLLEEQVITMHVSYNRDKYAYEIFDEWVHENSGDWAQPSIVGKKSFYKIFEEFNKL